uniref:Uncharacterized protein n=1 Tax=Arundo donax TaxID=35708 RepID=A0A0A9BWR0_ARUDO
MRGTSPMSLPMSHRCKGSRRERSSSRRRLQCWLGGAGAGLGGQRRAWQRG